MSESEHCKKLESSSIRIAEALEDICQVLHQINDQLKDNSTHSLHAETNDRLQRISDVLARAAALLSRRLRETKLGGR